MSATTEATPTVRRLDRGYVRDVPGEYTSGGYALAIHLAGADDTTPAHQTYPTGYDGRCGWCWLGANHSTAAHLQSLALAEFAEVAAR